MIRARGWGFRHAGRPSWALRGLDLTVARGERVLLAGPSGAGKSTLLTALAGLHDPRHSGVSEGRLDVEGRTGLMFQDPETQLVMARAGDDVAFGLENYAVPTDEIWKRVDEALELVGFPYAVDHPTGELSGGEKQRLVLAGVLALRPDILLLDEPTANLDPGGADLVRSTVARVLDETTATLLVVDHRVDEWLDVVDRVVVLEPGGGIITDGRPDQVFTREAESLAAQGVWVPGVPLPAPPRTGTAAEPVVEGRDLAYAYPGAARNVVERRSVELRAGEALAITGPNGAGKSTLALLLAGLLRPTAGEVRAVRAPGVRRPLHRIRAEQLIRLVGTVFQDPEHQFLTGTVRAELSLGPKLIGRSQQETDRKVDELLERLHLTGLATANPFTLSGGEKRRLSVATALASEPRTLILDEPTFGQDRRTFVEILHMLADLRNNGHAICCVSHDEAFVTALSDRRLEL